MLDNSIVGVQRLEQNASEWATPHVACCDFDSLLCRGPAASLLYDLPGTLNLNSEMEQSRLLILLSRG
jgi:hypothetical protein